MKTLIKITLLSLLFVSCLKDPKFPNVNYTMGGGVFLLNEGNYRSGNGSLSFYSYDSSKIYNDLFSTVNGRPLGDVPNSIFLMNTKAYIVVNNSGKIEVIDPSTFVSKATIENLKSPRNMASVNDTKAYVTSLSSDSVTIINLTSNTVSGYINVRRTSESIVAAGGKVFISNWAGGKEVMVIDGVYDTVVDSIQVGAEPESMVIDRNGRLWVLCNGGYARKDNAVLYEINAATNRIEEKFIFPSIDNSPTCLAIDGFGETLYYIDNGIWQMDIGSTSLPVTHIIEQAPGQYYYKIAINPLNGDILVTDAVDFSQLGNLYIYSIKGEFVTKQKAGIIPGAMSFRLTINTQTD
jgi:DNA-binding beta-propeller fold protein YncE